MSHALGALHFCKCVTPVAKKNIGAIKGSTHDGLQNFGQNAFGVEFLGGTTTIEHKLSKMIFYMKNLNLKPSHLTW